MAVTKRQSGKQAKSSRRFWEPRKDSAELKRQCYKKAVKTQEIQKKLQGKLHESPINSAGSHFPSLSRISQNSLMIRMS